MLYYVNVWAIKALNIHILGKDNILLHVPDGIHVRWAIYQGIDLKLKAPYIKQSWYLKLKDTTIGCLQFLGIGRPST